MQIVKLGFRKARNIFQSAEMASGGAIKPDSDRVRERIPVFHGDDARATIIGRSNRATFAMKKLAEWKETGGGSHAAGHARRSASPTIYFEAKRFPFTHYDPTTAPRRIPLDYPSVHTITSTRERTGEREIRKNCGWWLRYAGETDCAHYERNCSFFLIEERTNYRVKSHG